MLVRLLGNVRDTKLLQLLNALSGTVVYPSGMITVSAQAGQGRSSTSQSEMRIIRIFIMKATTRQ